MIWVAEIGSAHGGDKSLAFELIRQAKLAGATIAKFQFGWTKEAQLKYAGNYKDFRYVDDWAQDLKAWCDHFDIELMASIWSMEGLETARSVEMDRYKIAYKMDDYDLVDEMVKDEKQLISSNPNITGVYRLACVPEYPTYPNQLGWKGYTGISSYFNGLYGYSSHMHGIADALIAVSRGAQYIEKHITLNKADKTIRDNSFALLPEEFAEMVRIGNEIARLV